MTSRFLAVVAIPFAALLSLQAQEPTASDLTERTVGLITRGLPVDCTPSPYGTDLRSRLDRLTNGSPSGFARSWYLVVIAHDLGYDALDKALGCWDRTPADLKRDPEMPSNRSSILPRRCWRQRLVSLRAPGIWRSCSRATCSSEGDLEGASEIFSEAHARIPSAQSAQVALAHLDLLRGEPTNAAERMRQQLVATDDVTDPWYWYYKGVAWRTEEYVAALRREAGPP